MIWISAILLSVLGLFTFYLALLALLAIFARVRPPAAGPASRRFTVIVPAHDEELLIASTVRSILGVDYPPELFTVQVVADNCSDRTAELAAEAGAHVLVRRDSERRGKGYALDFALRRIFGGEGEGPDAVVIIDADTQIEAGLLLEFDADLAEGRRVIQGYYDVLEPMQHWRTALMYAALAVFHYVRPLGRRVLGCTAGLRGNGMCFARDVLEQRGWPAHGVIEDQELALMLLEEGIAVHFSPRARVMGQMTTSPDAAAVQRARWEGGHFELVRRHLLSLLAKGLKRRRLLEFDAAFDLLVPPFSVLVLATVAAMSAGAAAAFGIEGAAGFTLACLALLALDAFYLLTGLLLVRAPLRAYCYLLAAPVFVGWKLAVYVSTLLGRTTIGWFRTAREPVDTVGEERRS